MAAMQCRKIGLDMLYYPYKTKGRTVVSTEWSADDDYA